MPQANPIFSTINGVTISGTPTLGQVPTAVSGTYATWQTPAGGSSTPRINFNNAYAQVTGGNFSGSTAGTFSAGQNSSWAKISQGGGGSFSSYGYIENDYGVTAFQSNGGFKNLSGHLLLSSTNVGSDTGTIYMKFYSNSASSALNTVTANHIGLKDTVSASSSVTASTVGNGTSGSTTTLASSSIYKQPRIIGFSQPAGDGTDVTFYVDGASKNVHSTNQPTMQTASQLFGIHITTNGAGTNTQFLFQQWELQGSMF